MIWAELYHHGGSTLHRSGLDALSSGMWGFKIDR